MTRPLERFIIDITYLLLELIENTNYKYLLNILEHFSKYLFSYLLSDKKADSVYKSLNECFLDEWVYALINFYNSNFVDIDE